MLKNDSANTKITILFANKTESDILLRNQLEEMAHANPERVNVHFTIDDKTDGWPHFDGHINEGIFSIFFPCDKKIDLETRSLVRKPQSAQN